MRLKVIPLNENKNIVYFPDSLRFFETNNDTTEVLKDIVDEKPFEYFSSKYNDFSEETFKNLKNYCLETVKYEEVSKDTNVLSRLVLNISNVCNMKCKYCYAGGGTYGDKESFMNTSILEKILEFFYKCYENIEIIQLFGGEPTLNMEVINHVCRYVKHNKKSTAITMVTNGTNLTDELIECIFENQIYVTVSIDCKELHDNLRPFNSGKGTYEIIKNNINKLYLKTGQPNQVEITYTKMHDQQGISIHRLIESLKKDLVFDISAHVTPVCTKDPNYKLDTPERFFESINDYYKYIGSENQIHYSYVDRFLEPLSKHSKSKIICGGGIGTIAVDGKGNIYPCFYFVNNPEFIIGNVIIDNYEQLKQNIRNMQNKYISYNRYESEKCKDCFANTICFGCMGVNYSMTGDTMKSSDFHCEWIKKGLETTLINAVTKKLKGK
ncbi:MAG: radical SAM protein [Roseburia sp.]|nr:radical SAM protein [Roseburia sp.]MCM1278796.1 radical SAM protein [Robinsoniella sp.]